jgi:hypothetical protein
MEKDQKNIDKFFHHNLENTGEQPPGFIWDNISDALDSNAEIKRVSWVEKKRRYSIALLLLVILGSGALLLETAKETTDKKIVAVSPAPFKKSSPVSHTAGLPVVTGHIQNPITGNEDATASLPHASFFSLKEEQTLVSVAENEMGKLPVENRQYIPEAIPALFVKQETVATEAEKPFVNPVYSILENNSIAAKAKTVQTRRNSRFSVSVFFAPDITTRNLEQDLGSTAMDERKEEMLKTEKNGALDFTFGGRVEYQLNKHISFLSGISFSTNTIDIAKKTVFARYDRRDGSLKYRFNMSSGYCFFKLKKMPQPMSLGDSTEVVSSSSTLHYVNIPLAMKYNFPSGRFNFFMQAGITARFITKQSISAVYAFNGEKEKSTSTQINGLKTGYFNGVVGFGADYAINHRWAITLSPTFNFATSSINEEAPVKAYPNTVSIATGIKLHL